MRFTFLGLVLWIECVFLLACSLKATSISFLFSVPGQCHPLVIPTGTRLGTEGKELEEAVLEASLRAYRAG